MNFAWPLVLWLLALPACLLAWEVLWRRRLGAAEHPKILRAEAGMGGVTLAPRRAAGSPRQRRRYLLCAGVALAIVALARPRWGRIDEPMFDQSRDIVIALDLSRSMLTPDVRPSRLERAKLLVDSLLDNLKGERVGLIIFSGTAFLQSPVSSDYEILREFLPAMNPDYMPEGGTNYSQLLDTALDAFSGDSAADRYLIILSDGEATDEGWKDKVPQLTERGIKVIGLGVGTRAGGMIPDGSGAFMKDGSGAVVLSKLESSTLEDLAQATNGAYRDASQWVDISKLIESTVAKGRRGRFVEHNSVRYAERFQWPLAQALVCLVASFWLEFPVEPKSRAIRLTRTAPAAAVMAALLALLLPRPALGDEPAARQESAKLLSMVVGRLASQDARSAADWAEMSSDTLAWGQDVKSGGKPVPEQPVRDALRAVDEGQKADAKAADWPKLRSELEDLLKQPPQKKQDQKQNQQNQKQQDEQKQKDQKDQQGKRDQDQSKKDQDEDRQKQDQQQQQQQSGKQDEQKKEGGQQQKDKAFGNMGKPEPEPKAQPSQSAMKKVGGAKEEKRDDPARNDPELAVPLEKLEQLKNQDSPGQLFEMIRSGEPTPTPQNSGGKNW